MTKHVRLDRLLGRVVVATNNQPLGRIEEFRVEPRGSEWVIAQFVIGPAGLVERLGIGVKLVLGLKRGRGFVARWDQLDLTDPDRPRLTCAVDQLSRA
jgi:hypothetical protein